jgi:Tfp pilus assembly protein PilF
MLLKGKAELKQAAEAFTEVEKLGRYDGPLNLARVQFSEGDLDAATESLTRAAKMDPPPPTWTHSWLSGMVNRQQGNLRSAADSFTAVLETRVPERGFDFSLDYVVRNELGLTLVDLAQQADVQGSESEYLRYLEQAKQEFENVLAVDSENVTAHANLVEIYSLLGDKELETSHRELHTRYKPDDNAQEVAVPAARRRYPAANHAAEALVIYDLQRDPSGIAQPIE